MPVPRHRPLDEDLAALSALVVDRPARLGATRLVSIDGPAGSGKTSAAAGLADRLIAENTDVVTMHMDDLYDGWTGLDSELDRRVLDQLLRPLADGRPATWQRYDWSRGRFAEWHEVRPPELLVLEGCGSGAAGYSAYISVLVWVEAARDTRLQRGIRRDGPEMEPKWLAWMDLEEAHFRANRTRQRADLVIATG